VDSITESGKSNHCIRWSEKVLEIKGPKVPWWWLSAIPLSLTYIMRCKRSEGRFRPFTVHSLTLWAVPDRGEYLRCSEGFIHHHVARPSPARWP